MSLCTCLSTSYQWSCLSCFDFDIVVLLFFFKQKTAYEMRISDWSSDVCSSDLDKTANLRTEKDGAPTKLTAAEAGKPFEGAGYKIEGSGKQITATLPGKDRKSVV